MKVFQLSPATEWRPKVAHGGIVGFVVNMNQTPERGGRFFFRPIFYRPIRGLKFFFAIQPTVSPWATFCRASGALAALILIFAVGATAQTPNTLSDAEIQGHALVQKILAQQPVEGSTNLGILKFKDAKGKLGEVSVRFITKVRSTNWVSVFQGIESNAEAADKLAIIHEASQTNRYAVVHVCGPGITFSQLDAWGMQPSLEEDEKLVPFCRSDFTAMDLGLEFFHWPQQKVLKKEVRRSRGCTVLESTNPNPSTNGYSRVVSWIDEESGGIVQAEAYDFNNKLLKEFAPKSFKKVNGQWELQEMEIRNVQTGSRTRLEFDLKK
jgi:hypothetical protein